MFCDKTMEFPRGISHQLSAELFFEKILITVTLRHFWSITMYYEILISS